MDEGEYQDRDELYEFAKEIFEEHMENAEDIDFDLPEAQQELASRLGIEKKADVADILIRFYRFSYFRFFLCSPALALPATP